MYKDILLEWLKKNRMLVFTAKDASKVLGINGSALSNLLKAMVKNDSIGEIMKGRYYFNGAPIRDIFSIASKIIYPSYIATESAFERFGISNIIPKKIRVITTKAHRPINFNDADLLFIKFKPKRFFGYNESKWISISSIEKAFVDSLYLGEFPFFTDLVNYHKQLIEYGRQLDYEKLIDYTFRMDSRILINRVGFFLDYVNKGDILEKLIPHVYKKSLVAIDRSGQSFFNDKKWMIK